MDIRFICGERNYLRRSRRDEFQLSYIAARDGSSSLFHLRTAGIESIHYSQICQEQGGENMRGQTTLAYLVMAAAVLTIAVTTVVIFQSMITPTEAANLVLEDKYSASLVGIELVAYMTPYQGTEATAPKATIYEGTRYEIELYDDAPQNHGTRLVDLGANKIFGKFALSDDGTDVMKLQSYYSKFGEVLVRSASGTSSFDETGDCIYSATGVLKEDSLVVADSDDYEVAESTATVYDACGVSGDSITGDTKTLLTDTGWLVDGTFKETTNPVLRDKLGGGGQYDKLGPGDSHYTNGYQANGVVTSGLRTR